MDHSQQAQRVKCSVRAFDDRLRSPDKVGVEQALQALRARAQDSSPLRRIWTCNKSSLDEHFELRGSPRKAAHWEDALVELRFVLAVPRPVPPSIALKESDHRRAVVVWGQQQSVAYRGMATQRFGNPAIRGGGRRLHM